MQYRVSLLSVIHIYSIWVMSVNFNYRWQVIVLYYYLLMRYSFMQKNIFILSTIYLSSMTSMNFDLSWITVDHNFFSSKLYIMNVKMTVIDKISVKKGPKSRYWRLISNYLTQKTLNKTYVVWTCVFQILTYQ